MLPAADFPAAAEIDRYPADEKSGIEPRASQHPGSQRRRGRLSVRARDHQRLARADQKSAQRLRERDVGDILLEHRLRFRIAARYGVADDDQIRSGRDMLGAEARKDIDADVRQVRAHGRINILIRARHPVAAGLKQAGERRHADAANRDQMNMAARRRKVVHGKSTFMISS